MVTRRDPLSHITLVRFLCSAQPPHRPSQNDSHIDSRHSCTVLRLASRPIALLQVGTTFSPGAVYRRHFSLLELFHVCPNGALAINNFPL